MAKILAERVKVVIDKIVGASQNAFIHGRFILDGVLIANETVDYVKKCNSKCSVFKVDFEKAFDGTSCSVLCLVWGLVLNGVTGSTGSILVNGSPTNEFVMSRGVRQGNPLSPFLFIMVVEALNVIVNEAVRSNIF